MPSSIGALSDALDRKRLELLTLRKEQLAARNQRDAEIESQLDELRARLKAYEAPTRPPDPHPMPGAGIIRLGKKTPEGVVPIQAL
jgi:hypothetical protein